MGNMITKKDLVDAVLDKIAGEESTESVAAPTKKNVVQKIEERSRPNTPVKSIDRPEKWMIPSLSLTTTDLPVLDKKKVGDKVKIVIEAEICNQDIDGTNRLSVKSVG